MEFEWNEKKNRANIRKHGFDFADAKELFLGPFPFLVAAEEEEYHDGEERWRGIGCIRGRVVVCIFAERQPSRVRIISLRKATGKERIAYEKTIQDQLESR